LNIIFLVTGIVFALSLLGVQYVVASQSPWTLDVKLTNPPFGVKNVKVTIEGPFGYRTYKTISWQEQVNKQGAESGVIHVKFTIPSNVIPIGYQYKVFSTNLANIVDVLIPNWEWYKHKYEPVEIATIAVNVPGSRGK